MSAEADDAVDLDATSFNLENVDIIDEVDVHSKLICDDRVGVDVNVDVNAANDVSNGKESVLVEIDEEKKKAFEKRRDKILRGVPEEVKARFGKIYFSTFGKFVGPVLIMNPFNVEPGLLRDQWIHMFHNCQKSGREEQMTHLTYWYGQFNELNNAYSFQKTSQLLSYELGMKKTEKKLATIVQKQNSGKKLNSKEINFMNGFDEMEADRGKDPSERSGYVNHDFLEEYHMLPGEVQKRKQKKEGTEGKEKEKTRTKTKQKSDSAEGTIKKKKIKKGKKSTLEEKEVTTGKGTQELVENGEKLKPKKKLLKKRSKKADILTEASRPSKKTKSSGTDDNNPKISGELSEESIEKEAEKQEEANEKKSLNIGDDVQKGTTEDKDKDERPSAHEEFAELDEISSHGDTDDDSLKMDDLDDSEDEVYMPEKKSKATKKKLVKKKSKSEDLPAKAKEPPKKKTQQTKTKIDKSVVKGEKKSTIKLNLKKLHRKEQRKFHECEIEYLPLLNRWEKAITNKDVKRLSKIYDELLTTMQNFTAPFIEEYSMSDLLKRSKGFDNDKRAIVRSKFKTVYKEKRAVVPQNFKAIKEAEKYISPDVKTEPATKLATAIQEKETALQPESEKDGHNLKTGTNTKNVPDIPNDAPTPVIPKLTKKFQSCASDAETSRPPSPANKQIQPSTKVSRPTSPTEKEIQKSAKVSRPTSPTQKQVQPSAKVEKRKTFSLGKLMRPPSSSSSLGSVGTKVIAPSEEISGVASQPSKKSQTSPTWTIETVSNADYSNTTREFGVEFLQQAAQYIPESKSVNRNAMSQNLETAIYNWSTGKVNGKSRKPEEDAEGRWKDKYWNKVHDLAASISGKRKRGTLAGMIAEGKFSTPEQLVGLSDDELWCSFQGSPL